MVMIPLKRFVAIFSSSRFWLLMSLSMEFQKESSLFSEMENEVLPELLLPSCPFAYCPLAVFSPLLGSTAAPPMPVYPPMPEFWLGLRETEVEDVAEREISAYSTK